MLKIGRWNSVDPLADHPEQVAKSVYAYSWNDPISMIDEDGEFPIKGVITTARYAWRVYKIYKAVGRITTEGLKKAGIDELKGMADDFQTIFSSNASVSDRIGAAVDLIVGTELNDNSRTDNATEENSQAEQGQAEAKSIPEKGKRATQGTDASNHYEGIKKAQSKAKKDKPSIKSEGSEWAKSRPKQNKIQNTQKSKQNDKIKNNKRR